MEPSAGLDDVKRKLFTLPGLELRPFGRPVRSSRYTEYTISAPFWKDMPVEKQFEQLNENAVTAFYLRRDAVPRA
jgi:hypothetical protein